MGCFQGCSTLLGCRGVAPPIGGSVTPQTLYWETEGWGEAGRTSALIGEKTSILAPLIPDYRCEADAELKIRGETEIVSVHLASQDVAKVGVNPDEISGDNILNFAQIALFR